MQKEMKTNSALLTYTNTVGSKEGNYCTYDPFCCDLITIDDPVVCSNLIHKLVTYSLSGTLINRGVFKSERRRPCAALAT